MSNNPGWIQHEPAKKSNKKKLALWGGGCLGSIFVFLILMAGCGALISAVDEPTKDLAVAATPSPTTSTQSAEEKAKEEARIKANKEAEAKAKADAEAKAAAEAEAAAEEAKKKAEAEAKEEAKSQDEAAEFMLQMTWDAQDKDTRELVCAGLALDPDQMWTAFNEGAEDMVTRKQFETFFNKKC